MFRNLGARVRRNAGHDRTLTFVDQAVSSLGNFLAIALAARSLSQANFTDVAVSLVAVGISIQAGRALIGEPVLLGLAPSSAAPRAMALAATLVAVLAAVPTIVVVAGLSGSIVLGLMSSFLLLPLVLLQDAGRYLAFHRQQAGFALASDLAWVLVLCGLFVVDPPSSAARAVGYVACAVSFSLLPLLVTGLFCPSTSETRRFFKLTLPYSTRLLAEQGVAILTTQVTLIAAAAIAGTLVLAAARATTALAGPFVVANQAMLVLSARESLQYQDRPPRVAALRASLVLGLSAVLYSAAMLAIPDRAGVALLGETWSSASAAIPAMVTWLTVGSLAAGPYIALRGSRMAPALLRCRLLLAPVAIVLPVAGAVNWSTSGYFVGASAALLLQGVVYWVMILRFENANAGVSGAVIP